jgi:HlyD family secretion protein
VPLRPLQLGSRGQTLNGSKKKLFWLSSLVIAIVAGGFLAFRADRGSTGPAETAPTQHAANQQLSRISCLGHIEPKDGIVWISVRSLSGQPSIIGELKVHEGDWVNAGQVVAVLDSHRQLEETVQNLKAQVAVAQSRLAIAKTSAVKKGDLAAQQAEIGSLEATLVADRTSAARYEALYQKQAATVTERDQSALQVETATQMLSAARSRLLSLEEGVREVDVSLAEAELRVAMANVATAEADLEPTIVRAPSSGRVLKILANPGEEAGPQGVLELGRTDTMYVIAEVVESDISRVRIGQKATITSEALALPLHGEVESIGTQVTNEDLSPTDPKTFSDARVVEVKIRLDDSAAAASLIHGKVTAVIEP